MNFYDKRNNAITSNDNTVNGRTADIAITTHGSDWYFAVCGVMTLATLIFGGLATRKPRHDRIFHYITASITAIAAVAYFTMGSNLGFTPIPVEYLRSSPKVHGVNREIFYARYVDWALTTPLLLTDLLLTAGMPWPNIVFIIIIDELMIITGLIGALVASSYKWAYFTFGCMALVYIIYQLAFVSRKHANSLGPAVGRTFTMCGSLTLFLWCMYPIAWGVSEGGNIIAPDSEAVFYGILDLLAKPVFGALLIFGHRNISPADLGLRIRDFSESPKHHGGTKSEKHIGHNHGVNTTGDNVGGVGTTGYNNNGVTGTGYNNNGVTGTGATTTGGLTGHHNNGVTGTGATTTGGLTGHHTHHATTGSSVTGAHHNAPLGTSNNTGVV